MAGIIGVAANGRDCRSALHRMADRNSQWSPGTDRAPSDRGRHPPNHPHPKSWGGEASSTAPIPSMPATNPLAMDTDGPFRRPRRRGLRDSRETLGGTSHEAIGAGLHPSSRRAGRNSRRHVARSYPRLARHRTGRVQDHPCHARSWCCSGSPRSVLPTGSRSRDRWCASCDDPSVAPPHPPTSITYAPPVPRDKEHLEPGANDNAGVSGAALDTLVRNAASLTLRSGLRRQRWVGLTGTHAALPGGSGQSTMAIS
jgi:hypothetical protein